MEERYSYRREIAGVSHTEADGEPTGTLTVLVSYDGPPDVPDGGLRDARRALASRDGDLHGCVGHLALVDHGRTNLAALLGRGQRQLALPLRAPLRAADSGDAEVLVDDNFRFRERLRYVPCSPHLVPITVGVTLEDDHLRRLCNGFAKWESPSKHFQEIVSTLTANGATERQLLIRIDVEVHLTAELDEAPEAPRLRRVGIRMPRIRSSTRSTICLRGTPPSALQYDSIRGALEWFDIDMSPFEATSTPGGVRQRSAIVPMTLVVAEPGEIFEGAELIVETDVELPGVLLSGTRAKLFDAVGRCHRDDPLVVRSTVTCTTVVALREAYAERERTLAQVWCFDEIVPHRLRISEIEAVLRAQAYEIVGDTAVDLTPHVRKDREPVYWLVRAKVTDGATSVRLLVLVQGRHSATRRKAQQAEGHEYSSRFASGDLTLYVHGTTVGDDPRLWQRVNELHTELRRRFLALRAQR